MQLTAVEEWPPVTLRQSVALAVTRLNGWQIQKLLPQRA
jgi:hypothetical protein